jgi:hypothetical protein
MNLFKPVDPATFLKDLDQELKPDRLPKEPRIPSKGYYHYPQGVQVLKLVHLLLKSRTGNLQKNLVQAQRTVRTYEQMFKQGHEWLMDGGLVWFDEPLEGMTVEEWEKVKAAVPLFDLTKQKFSIIFYLNKKAFDESSDDFFSDLTEVQQEVAGEDKAPFDHERFRKSFVEFAEAAQPDSQFGPEVIPDTKTLDWVQSLCRQDKHFVVDYDKSMKALVVMYLSDETLRSVE